MPRSARSLAGLVACTALTAPLPADDAPPPGYIEITSPSIRVIRSSDGAGTVGVISAGETPILTQYDGAVSYMNSGRASGRLAELLRPEFLRRDAALYARELSLHREQLPVLRMLLEIYREEFDTAAEPLRTALRRRQESQMLGLNRPLASADVLFPGVGAGDEPNIEPRFVVLRNTSGGETSGQEGSEPVALPAGATVSFTVAARSSSTDPDEAPQGMRTPFPEGTVMISASSMEIQIDEESIRAMRERLSERVRAAHERAEAMRRKLEEEGPIPTAAEIVSMARAFLVQRDEMAERFRTDLDLILSTSQQELLDRAHRLQRLNGSLPLGRFGGETVDLRALSNQLALRPAHPEAFEELLEDWMLGIDALLAARTDAQIEFELASLRADAARESQTSADEDSTERLAQRIATIRSEIVEQTETFLQAIRALLDDADAFEWLTEARRRGFPDIYRTSQVLAAHAAAIADGRLTEDLRDVVTHLHDLYAAQLHEFNEQLVAEARRTAVDRAMMPYETRRLMQSVMDAHQRREAPDLNPVMNHTRRIEQPAQDLTQRRTENALAALRMLRDLLGRELFNELPGANLLDPPPRRFRASDLTNLVPLPAQD